MTILSLISLKIVTCAIPFNVRKCITCRHSFVLLPSHPWLHLYEVRTCWNLSLVANLPSESLWNTFQVFPGTVQGTQPPRWHPVIPASWYLGPYIVFFHTEEGWLTHPVDYYRNDRMWLPRWDHKSHCHLCLFLLDYLLQGKPAAMSWGHSWNPTERSMRRRTESSCQKPREWASLEVDSPLPAKPSDDCSHSQHFNCNFMKDAEPATHSSAAARFPTLRNWVR